MADVFLMGTAGSYSDPNRSMWREPIKAACAKVGITCFDPVVPVWNDEAMQRETEALASCKVIVMAVTTTTAGIASLAESGWAALSAITRRQSFGLWVDPEFKGIKVEQVTMMIKASELMAKAQVDTLEESSRRARKLVNSHARKLSTQFPTLNLYVATNLNDLTAWTVKTATRLVKQQPTGR